MATTKILHETLCGGASRRLFGGKLPAMIDASSRLLLRNKNATFRASFSSLCRNNVGLRFVSAYTALNNEAVLVSKTKGSYNRTMSSPPCIVGRPMSTSSASTTPISDEEYRNNVIPFLLADIGEGIAEVELLQWFVNPGETVKQFDRICEVQSDKATVEITSRFDGVVVSLDGDVGEMMKVGSPLIHLQIDGEQNESIDQSDAMNNDEEVIYQEKLNIPSVASKYHLKSDEGTPPDKKSPVLTTPAVRKLAMEYDLDLRTIVGTGPKGRVLKSDVLSLLRDGGKYREVAATNPHNCNDSEVRTISNTAEWKDKSPANSQEKISTEQLRGFSRLMAQSMTASLAIPHMCYSDEIDMGAAMGLKGEISILPLSIKAVSLALSKFPILNASFDGQETVTYYHDHNIGVAVDTPRGLVVPVIRSCQEKSIHEISEELKRMKELAKTSSFPADDLQGATFTISNIGAVGGGTYMSPIVTPPQVAIGAMGRIQRLPRFESDDSMDVKEAFIMAISWAGDHRIIDGATLARFHNLWKKYMESPVSMMTHMK